MKKLETISISSILLFFMCVFAVRPYYVQLYNSLDNIWAGIGLLLAVISMIIAVKKRVIRKDIIIVALALVYLLATFVNESNNLMSAASTMAQIILAYNVGILVFAGENVNKNISIVQCVIFIYIFLYIICGFLHISERVFEQQETITFFGYDNYAAFIILPLLAIKWGLSCYKNSKISFVDMICWLLCLLYHFTLRTYTAIVILLLLGVLYIVLRKIKDFRCLLSPKYVVGLIVILLIGVVGFNVQYIFEDILVAVGKGVTLNSRTLIWGNTIDILSTTPLYGYGHLAQGSFQVLIGLNPIYYVEASHAHNIILDVIIRGGFIGLILYFLLLGYSTKNMRYYYHKIEIRTLATGVALFLLLGFFDGYPFISAFYLVLSLLRGILDFYRRNDS